MLPKYKDGSNINLNDEVYWCGFLKYSPTVRKGKVIKMVIQPSSSYILVQPEKDLESYGDYPIPLRVFSRIRKA